MIVYDITSQSSFKATKGILDRMRENADRNAIFVLVGNKSDLKHLREVTTDEGKQFAQENKMDFIETSALDASNVELAFHQFATTI